MEKMGGALRGADECEKTREREEDGWMTVNIMNQEVLGRHE